MKKLLSILFITILILVSFESISKDTPKRKYSCKKIGVQKIKPFTQTRKAQRLLKLQRDITVQVISHPARFTTPRI